MGKNTEDRRVFNKQKTKMTAALIASVAAAVAEDHRVSIQDLAWAHGTSYGTISRILHSQLGLVKKSARWVPKLLSKEQKEERVNIEGVRQTRPDEGADCSGSNYYYGRVIFSMHTPETKQQSKQWLKKALLAL